MTGVSRLDVDLPEDVAAPFAEIKEMASTCMQCGTCTASCPNAFAMDHTPRQILRLVQLGFFRDVIESRTFWLCSSCYMCTLRCPRGVPVTRAMTTLKRIARMADRPDAAKHSAFYRTFMNSVRRYGRVQETDLMIRYFIAMCDPLLPFDFAWLGLRLMGKGKLHAPRSTQKGRLEGMFRKAAEMEGRN